LSFFAACFAVFGNDFFGKIFSREISRVSRCDFKDFKDFFDHEDLRFLRFHERDPSSS